MLTAAMQKQCKSNLLMDLKLNYYTTRVHAGYSYLEQTSFPLYARIYAVIISMEIQPGKPCNNSVFCPIFGRIFVLNYAGGTPRRARLSYPLPGAIPARHVRRMSIKNSPAARRHNKARRRDRCQSGYIKFTASASTCQPSPVVCV